MVTYAVGDIQGCSATLQRLLDRLRGAGFDERADTLWLAGDLVNRGPCSLAVLRWAVEQERRMGPRLVVVLGNHDLHLLGVAAGVERVREGDTFGDVLATPARERDELIGWLRRRPLLHRADIAGRPHLMVHAGLLPQWSTADAAMLAHAIEVELGGDDWPRALTELRRHKREPWSERLTGAARRGVAASALMRLRTCTAEGRPCDGFSGPPDEAPAGCLPWFDVPSRRSRDHRVVCGHWATLGLRLRDDLVALDTGCVWGQSLTAVRLEDRAVFSEPNAEDR
jgi:bis(5'-nucleosyl)-tetraphosphatase (symmetrical)